MHASHLDVILLELGQGIVKELAALALIFLLGDVVARLHVENHVLKCITNKHQPAHGTSILHTCLALLEVCPQPWPQHKPSHHRAMNAQMFITGHKHEHPSVLPACMY